MNRTEEKVNLYISEKLHFDQGNLCTDNLLKVTNFLRLVDLLLQEEEELVEECQVVMVKMLKIGAQDGVHIRGAVIGL